MASPLSPPTWASALWRWLARYEACVRDYSIQLDDLRCSLNIQMSRFTTFAHEKAGDPNVSATHEKIRAAAAILISDMDELLNAHSFGFVRGRATKDTTVGKFYSEIIPSEIQQSCAETKEGLARLLNAEQRLYEIFCRENADREANAEGKRRFGAFVPLPAGASRSEAFLGVPASTLASYSMGDAGTRCAQLLNRLTTQLGSISSPPAENESTVQNRKKSGRREHSWKSEILRELRRRIAENYKRPQMDRVLAEQLIKWAKANSAVRLRPGELPPSPRTVENWIRPVLRTL